MAAEHRKRCPGCGKPTGYLLEIHTDKPGFCDLLRGKGDWLTRRVAWSAVLLFAVGVVTALFALTGIH